MNRAQKCLLKSLCLVVLFFVLLNTGANTAQAAQGIAKKAQEAVPVKSALTRTARPATALPSPQSATALPLSQPATDLPTPSINEGSKQLQTAKKTDQLKSKKDLLNTKELLPDLRDKKPQFIKAPEAEMFFLNGGSNTDPTYHPERQPTKTQFNIEADAQSGALTYSFPINIPPGRNGLQPNLALTYNSQNTEHNNISGQGFNLTIPYIERIARKGTDKLYTENYFSSSLSGELAAINLTDATHGLYGAKVDAGSFLNYTFNVNNQWIVTTKNGQTYKFGLNQGARQDDPGNFTRAYKWMLEELRDANDNFVKYEYNKDGGQIYPVRISYTGHGNTEGIFEVLFSYEARPDSTKQYNTGFEVSTVNRLKAIETRVNGEWVGKYEFEYTTGQNGVVSLLKDITNSGRDENGIITALPKTEFGYQVSQAAAKGWIKDMNYQFPQAYFRDKNGNEHIGTATSDVNGDGLIDIIAAFSSGGTPTNKVYLNKGDGTGWALDMDYQMPVYLYQHNDNEFKGVQIADVNGDNLDDVISSSDESNDHQDVYINNRESKAWIKNSNYSIPVYFNQGGDSPQGVRIFDVNGDGLVDLVQAKLDSSNYTAGVYINNGDQSGWTKDPNYTIPSNILFRVPDPSEDAGVYAMDVNGDGLVDLVQAMFDGTSYKTVYLNKGNGTGWLQNNNYVIPVYFNESNSNDYKGVRVADVNGDGLPDLIRSTGFTTNNNSVYINQGNDTGWVLDNDYFVPMSFINGGDDDEGGRVFDVNGDGMADVVQSKKDSSYSIQNIYINNGQVANLLTHIKTSSGAQTDITYKSTVTYKVGDSLANAKLPMALQTVKTISADDGFGSIATTGYQYEDGEYYYNTPYDRKFAGFGKVITVDSLGNVTKQYFHQGNGLQLGEVLDHKAKINLMYRDELYDNQQNLYAQTVNKWERVDLGSERNFVYVQTKLKQDYDGDLSHRDTAQVFVYDTTTGNLTQQTDWGEVDGNIDGSFDDLGDDKLVTDFFYATDGADLIGLQSQVITKDQQNNKIFEIKTYYDNLPLGQVTDGNQTKQEHWLGNNDYINIQVTYNQYGLPIQQLDANGNATNFTYDAYNLAATTVTNAKNQDTNFEYNYAYGTQQALTDANNAKIKTAYDGLGRVTATEVSNPAMPANFVTASTASYDTASFPQSVTQTAYAGGGLQVSTVMFLDGFSRPIQTRTEAEGVNQFTVTSIIYNQLGQVQKELLPKFASGADFEDINAAEAGTSYSYDALGRVTQVVNPLGTTSNVYNDWIITATDPNNKQKKLHYDARGNLTEVKEYLNGNPYTTFYDYDALNNLTKITDAKDNLRHFTYDLLGRKLSQEDLHTPNDATFGTWTYTYDQNGNLLTELNPKNQIIAYTYDALNRPLTESANAKLEVTYTYDQGDNGIGKLTTVTNVNPDLKKSFEYDILGRLTKELKDFSAPCCALQINLGWYEQPDPQKLYLTQFAYDIRGAITQLTYPDDVKILYGFNNAGQLATVSKTVDGVTAPLVSNLDYAPSGALSKIEYANGVVTTNTYDLQKLYRLTNKLTIKDTDKLQDISYSYDAVGNVLMLTEDGDLATARTATYEYDDLYRLTKATVINTANSKDYVREYSYDIIGNILSRSDVGSYTYAGGDSTISNTVTTNPHAVTAAGGISYTYDLNGNLIANGTWQHLWDYKNRLGASVGPHSIQYTYDEQGQRLKKNNYTTYDKNLYINKYFEVDMPYGGLIKERKYIYAGDLKIATDASKGTTVNLLYHHSDHLSGASVDTDATGAVANLFDYYPFGDLRLEQTPGVATNQLKNDYKFTGKELDEDTGLYYYGARYYDAGIGRFAAVDPWAGDLKDPQSLNKYSYVRNNPLKYVDPRGEWFLDVVGSFTGGFVNAIGSNAMLGIARAGAYDAAFQAGQKLGDATSVALGALESAFGILTGVGGGGAGLATAPITGPGNLVLAASAAGAGAAITAHGLGFSATGLNNLMQDNSGGGGGGKGNFSNAPDHWGNAQTLDDHFGRHGKNFGAKDAPDYAQKANDFYKNAQKNGYEQITDQDGVQRIYDAKTNTLGSYNKNGTTKTFLKPSQGQKYWQRQVSNPQKNVNLTP